MMLMKANALYFLLPNLHPFIYTALHEGHIDLYHLALPFNVKLKCRKHECNLWKNDLTLLGKRNRWNKNWQGTNSFQWLNSFPFHNWMLCCTHTATEWMKKSSVPFTVLQTKFSPWLQSCKCILICFLCVTNQTKCNQCNELFEENLCRPLPLCKKNGWTKGEIYACLC